jgi:ATP-binding cassette subfamily B protein
MAIEELAEFTLKNSYRTNRRGPVRWVLSHAARHWALLIVAIGGAFGNAALMGITSVLIGQAFSAILSTEPQLYRLGQIAIVIALSQLTRGVLQFGRNFGFELIAQRVERNVRDELYGSLLGKSMTFHNLQPVGDTMARATNDVREVNFLFSPGVNMVIGSLNFLILTPGRYHPALLLAPGLFIVAYFLALRTYLRRLAPITDEVRESFGQLNTRLNEALDGIETVKGSSQELGEVKLFERNANRYRNAVVTQGNEEARFVPLLIYSIALAGGLLHALILFQQGLLSDIGAVVGYFGLLLMLDFPTFTSLWAYSQISLGLAGARRILELMNRENDLDQNTSGFAGEMRGEVVFENVCFAYPKDQTTEEQRDCTLAGVNITIKPGKTVAIVGQTGSGKTSLAKLINRIYDVTEGRVLVDGVDVRQWNLEALRRHISIIEQDVFLFSDTITKNIAFGKPGATQAEIEGAAEAAQAHEFISSFADGYGTVIGERGVTLSGGQRQRLALARAFLTDPRILVLDDSTSAIDSATEDKIQRAIFNAARGRTTLIITHRLSQIRWADLIVVMRQGRIAAIGSHEELMRQSDAYRRIFGES